MTECKCFLVEKASQDQNATSLLLLALFGVAYAAVFILPKPKRSSLNQRVKSKNILTTTAREEQQRLNAIRGKVSQWTTWNLRLRKR
ncbi:hypothetical protein COS55_00755 [Candidatus Shapirobacteria bacterium CG03_land_8_20_14_0_80_40_19]|uniref:Uncharacterized protein n=1 Tax=Candidatus Shapirobacteria bacterium CG03_land_8_20_14_0_80_40_19 TaxID=1974880 RepID=A0A2M7BFP9_9BACT|nr:MAG: hypothetical protein COS55_00755 [Candidatus Shapirobacteria bacterium CG03_land_8_20_14_0_80_40_19]